MIVGIGNKCRQGKDSAALAIYEYYTAMRSVSDKHGVISKTPKVGIFRFAEALYEECRRDHGMVGKDAALLQKVGQERRTQNPNYWVDQVAKQLSNFYGIALITDCRYKNEAAWIKSVGGVLLNVTRLNHDGTQFISNDRDPKHISEIDLDGYNWDARISTKTGETALAAELAITTVNYFYSLECR